MLSEQFRYLHRLQHTSSLIDVLMTMTCSWILYIKCLHCYGITLSSVWDIFIVVLLLFSRIHASTYDCFQKDIGTTLSWLVHCMHFYDKKWKSPYMALALRSKPIFCERAYHLCIKNSTRGQLCLAFFRVDKTGNSEQTISRLIFK